MDFTIDIREADPNKPTELLEVPAYPVVDTHAFKQTNFTTLFFSSLLIKKNNFKIQPFGNHNLSRRPRHGFHNLKSLASLNFSSLFVCIISVNIISRVLTMV